MPRRLDRSPWLALLLITACARPASKPPSPAPADAGRTEETRRPSPLAGKLTPPPGDVLELSVYQWQPDGGHPEERLAVARIEADGRFSTEVTSRPLLVRWYPRGASVVERVVIEGEDDVALTTPVGVAVKGKVLLAPRSKESPMVELRRDGEVLSNAQSPPYDFRGVTPGPATLVAYFGQLGELNARCVRRDLQIGTDDLTFDLDLRDAWVVEGRVVDSTGRPLAGQYVWLVDAPEACSAQRALTDARGRYQLRDVPGDTAHLKGPADVRVSVVRGKTVPDLVIPKPVP
jgi:hypothetical protein